MYRIAAYSHSDSEVKEIKELTEISEFIKKYPVAWLDITTPTEKDIEKLEELFNFHKLALEDCLHTTQRSKVDNYGDYFFLIIKAVNYDKVAEAYQLSMFVGRNYIVTIRERDDPNLINPIFEKISLKSPGIVKSGTDYLCYILLDTIVDDYFPVFDKLDDEVEDIEEEIVKHTAKESVKRIFKLKKDLLVLRKAIFPTMAMIAQIQRGDLPNISKRTSVYFNDIYDHIVEVIDLLETSRELVSGALEIHMSKMQNVINEIAKMFAMFAIILMWPTVIGAIYGMNFPDIPEYHWGIYGYIFALVLMITLMVLTWVFFKRKGWV